MNEVFDPARHHFGPSRYFEDFTVGETFYIPSRTVTDAQFAAFQTVCGDNHPIHYDRPFCRAHGHRDLLAHGFQVLAQTAAGAGIFPHLINDSLIGFLEQSSRFLKPVYAGDTLYPLLSISALKPQRTTGVLVCASSVHNQDGIRVLEGSQTYLLRRRAPDPGHDHDTVAGTVGGNRAKPNARRRRLDGHCDAVDGGTRAGRPRGFG